MRTIFRITLGAIVGASVLLLTACSSTTTIKSVLELDAESNARIKLGQETQAIDVHNQGDAPVRILVLDKKDRVLSNMLLGGHDQARLDLFSATTIASSTTWP
ncbi:MAG: hypothetical protein ACYTGF_03725 [Planctomycetota bacterium]|jgi:hypothetical protein